MKNILVPTDFSIYAEKATQVASRICLATGASLTLQHNIPTLVQWSRLSPAERNEYPETLGQTTIAEATLRKRATSSEFGPTPINTIVSHGIIYDQILNQAYLSGSELIVLGAHGNDTKRHFIGSNFQKVFRESTVPVLMVKSDVNEKPWKSIVLPIILDEDVRMYFQKFIPFIKSMNLTIHLLYINTPSHFKNSRTIQELMNRFKSHYPDLNFVDVVYNHEIPDEGILEYSKSVDADFIGMISHKHKQSPNYLVGITEAVIYHSEIPVLALARQ